jgi:glyoxylase-like metal-dependent hydrolase (beta-lactamase superfamily II)/ferredoxin
MADLKRRLPENAPGDFFVDETCIDCDACRQLDPATFRDHGGASSVYHQPANEDEAWRAMLALVACPTGSIGTVSRRSARRAAAAFPLHLAEDVYFCGYTAESSFGAWSYLILRPIERGGNVLIDSPRFAAPLVKRIGALGGIRTLFLTHRDDVADHAAFAREFGCERVCHADDGAARLGAERIIEGTAPIALDDELLVIPTPGHTRGHLTLLYRERFLFTGDHLAWSPERGTLVAFRNVVWYSRAEQVRSMERLQEYRFEWVLPGHGRIHHDTPAAMAAHLARCVEWMRRTW